MRVLYVPHEVVNCWRDTVKLKDLLHYPFHSYYFISAVHIAFHIERLLSNTENQNRSLLVKFRKPC